MYQLAANKTLPVTWRACGLARLEKWFSPFLQSSSELLQFCNCLAPNFVSDIASPWIQDFLPLLSSLVALAATNNVFRMSGTCDNSSSFDEKFCEAKFCEASLPALYGVNSTSSTLDTSHSPVSSPVLQSYNTKGIQHKRH